MAHLLPTAGRRQVPLLLRLFLFGLFMLAICGLGGIVVMAALAVLRFLPCACAAHAPCMHHAYTMYALRSAL